jgi:hypothetical protein
MRSSIPNYKATNVIRVGFGFVKSSRAPQYHRAHIHQSGAKMGAITDQDETSRLGSDLYQSNNRAAKTSLAVSASKAIALAPFVQRRNGTDRGR